MSEIPNWITGSQKKILVGFKQQGGTGNIADVRRLADVSAGDAHIKPLVKHGLVLNPSRDFYKLLPSGYEIANLLLEKGAD